ncbi:MAG: hypothetical protein GXO48_01615 [Chlorobi bacterium]|nr:hypothetical protein [Chlorobiota bacterium]
MNSNSDRRKGVLGSFLLTFLGFLTIVVFAFRRDELFWLASLGWIIGVVGSFLFTLFTVGWRGSGIKLALGVVVIEGIFISSVFIGINTRKKLELEMFGLTTKAEIIKRTYGPCWVCDQGYAVKIRFRDHKGRVVEYWHPCNECVFADSVVVRYSTLDPHLNVIVKTLP